MSKEISFLLEEYRDNYDIKITPFIESVTSYKTYRRKVMSGESLNMFTLFDLIDKTYYSYYEFFYNAHGMIYGYDLLHNLGSFMISTNESFLKEGYENYHNRLKLKPNQRNMFKETINKIKSGKIKDHLLELNNILGPLEQETVIKNYEFTQKMIEKNEFESWISDHFTDQYFTVMKDYNLSHISIMYFKQFRHQRDLKFRKYFKFLLNINHWTSGYMMQLIAANWFFSVTKKEELKKHIHLYHDYIHLLDQLIQYGARNHHFMEHYYYHKANHSFLNDNIDTFNKNISKYILLIKLIKSNIQQKEIFNSLKKTFSVNFIKIVKEYLQNNTID
jgi:hypothetical protein